MAIIIFGSQAFIDRPLEGVDDTGRSETCALSNVPAKSADAANEPRAQPQLADRFTIASSSAHHGTSPRFSSGDCRLSQGLPLQL